MTGPLIQQNWKSIPDHFFRKRGGLNFLFRCNYDPRYLDPKLPIFYRDKLSFFVQIKRQLKLKDEQEIILFNNKEILIDGNLSLLGNGLQKELFQQRISYRRIDNSLLMKSFKENIVVKPTS